MDEKDLAGGMPEPKELGAGNKLVRIVKPSEAVKPTRRPSSPAKRKANRRTALCSAGPKTPTGKAKVAANARKHGLLLRAGVLVPGGLAFAAPARSSEAARSREELQRLLRDRVVTRQPDGSTLSCAAQRCVTPVKAPKIAARRYYLSIESSWAAPAVASCWEARQLRSFARHTKDLGYLPALSGLAGVGFALAMAAAFF